MAAPFAPEDLKKLHTFVEFVSSNPSILNLPQLDFLKKLIEKFGGKVPEGDFEMPAGGKCPFGGDVKSESTATPPPSAAAEQEDEDKSVEVEEESEESEVELDMEANNITLFEPNVLYLEEKPPTVVKSRKSASNTNIRKKNEPKKTITKCRNKTKTSVIKPKILQEYIVKQELSILEDPKEEMLRNMDPNDPLYTPLIEIKCELTDDNDEKSETPENCQDDDSFDPNYEIEDQEDDYEMFEGKLKNNKSFEEDEDEPLIMLTRSKGRPRKYPIKGEDDGKVKAPRLVQCNIMCKQRCTEKFTEEQRKSICDFYWTRSKEDQLLFIRKHTKSIRLTRLRRKRSSKRGNNCCYYLSDAACVESTDLIRVCRKYFEATLCVSNHYIKKALDGYVLEAERDLKIITDMIKTNKENKTLEKSNEIKQILDPVTGNLITIDPNDKTKTLNTASTELKPKKKRIRRKPGDPLPEHIPKPIKCALRCIHKCHTKFSEQERKQICDIFWSMDFKRRKDFILASIEIKEVETETTPEFRKANRQSRSYHTRFFLRNGLHGESKRVCKHFMINTLCTNRSFISNAIEFADKTTGYYTGADRRGQHPSSNKISAERKQYILDHITSYPTWVPNKKSKSKYLHHSLSIKKMYQEYKEKCARENEKSVSTHYYYKAFHEDFRLLFLANPDPKKSGGFLNQNPNISHYTGEEPGGFWLDSNGQKLDFRLYNPVQAQHTQHYCTIGSQDFPLHLNPPLNFASTPAANQMIHMSDPVNQPSSSRAISDQPSVVRHDLNPNLYDNLPHSTASIFKKL